MGILVYSLSWVMKDLYHQPYLRVARRCGAALCGTWCLTGEPAFRKDTPRLKLGVQGLLGFRVSGLGFRI